MKFADLYPTANLLTGYEDYFARLADTAASTGRIRSCDGEIDPRQVHLFHYAESEACYGCGDATYFAVKEFTRVFCCSSECHSRAVMFKERWS